MEKQNTDFLTKTKKEAEALRGKHLLYRYWFDVVSVRTLVTKSMEEEPDFMHLEHVEESIQLFEKHALLIWYNPPEYEFIKTALHLAYPDGYYQYLHSTHFIIVFKDGHVSETLGLGLDAIFEEPLCEADFVFTEDQKSWRGNELFFEGKQNPQFGNRAYSISDTLCSIEKRLEQSKDTIIEYMKALLALNMPELQKKGKNKPGRLTARFFVKQLLQRPSP